MSARWIGGLAVTVLVGCGSVSSAVDADGAGCDPLARFDPPQALNEFDPALAPADPSLSPDELTMFLTQNSPVGDRDLYMAARGERSGGFGTPIALTSLNSSGNDAAASISADGLTLLFHSKRIAGTGQRLYVATRPSMLAAFGAPTLLGGVASPTAASDDMQAFLTSDGQELWFVSNRGGDLGIYRAPREGGEFANPVEVTELESPDLEQHVTLSVDRLTVYFSSNRVGFGSQGGFDIYRSRRASVNEPFAPPTIVEELATSASDSPRWLSPDNCRLYLHSDIGGGGFKIYVATRRPSS